MRTLMATPRGPVEGEFSGGKWKTLLMVLLIGTSVESSHAAGSSSDKSERGLMVVTHTSGETREKRAGEDDFGREVTTTVMPGQLTERGHLGMWVRYNM